MTFAIFILTVAALPPQKAASQPPSGAPPYDRSPHCRTASHSGSSSFKLPPPGKKWSVRAAVGIRQDLFYTNLSQITREKNGTLYRFVHFLSENSKSGQSRQRTARLLHNTEYRDRMEQGDGCMVLPCSHLRDLRIERKSNMWRITVYKIHEVAPYVKRQYFIFI